MGSNEESKADGKPTAGEAKPSPRRLHRAIHAKLPEELSPACEALGRHVRDLGNTATWLARTAFDCFEWTGGASRLKPAELLPASGPEVLAAFNKAIAAQNAKRLGKQKRLAEEAAEAEASAKQSTESKAVVQGEKTKPTKAAKAWKPKQLALLDSSCTKPAAIILDSTLFKSVVRNWPDRLDPLGRTAHSRLSAWVAEREVERVQDAFRGWLRSLSEFAAGGHLDKASRPQMPGFHPKSQLPWVSVSLSHKQYCRRLPPILTKQDARRGEAKDVALEDAQAAAWNGFDLGEWVSKSLVLRHGSKSADWTAGEFKFKPAHAGAGAGRKRRGVEAMICVSSVDSFPEGSFLSELEARRSEEFKLRGGDRLLMMEWGKRIASGLDWGSNPDRYSEKNDSPYAWVQERHSAMGIDPGVSNAAAVASSSGAPMLIFSAGTFDAKIERLEAKLDRAVSKATQPRLRELDAKRSREGSLDMAERIERRTLIKAVHQSPEVDKIRRRIENAKIEFCGKLAAWTAGAAVRQKAAIVALSRNKGLKDAAGLSTAQEKRSHRLPHAMLAGRLFNALWRKGILLVECEESFTSQSSFVDGERLPAHPAGAAQEQKAAAKAQRRAAKKVARLLDGAPASPELVEFQQPSTIKEPIKQLDFNPKAEFSATRASSGSQRRWLSRRKAFGEQGGDELPRRVHADGQAAYNAIRKASPGFGHHKGLSLRFDLLVYVRNDWRLRGSRPGASPPASQPSLLKLNSRADNRTAPQIPHFDL